MKNRKDQAPSSPRMEILKHIPRPHPTPVPLHLDIKAQPDIIPQSHKRVQRQEGKPPHLPVHLQLRQEDHVDRVDVPAAVLQFPRPDLGERGVGGRVFEGGVEGVLGGDGVAEGVAVVVEFDGDGGEGDVDVVVVFW